MCQDKIPINPKDHRAGRLKELSIHFQKRLGLVRQKWEFRPSQAWWTLVNTLDLKLTSHNGMHSPKEWWLDLRKKNYTNLKWTSPIIAWNQASSEKCVLPASHLSASIKIKPFRRVYPFCLHWSTISEANRNLQSWLKMWINNQKKKPR